MLYERGARRRATAIMSYAKCLGLALVWRLSIVLAASEQTTGATDAITAALRARNFAHAAERSRVALQRTPNDPQLWTPNGLALVGAGKRADALQSFQHGLKIDPDYL